MRKSDIKSYEILPNCLCNLDLPHTSEHVRHLPPQLMPMLQFPSEKDEEDEKEKRLRELLTDLEHATADTDRLRKKYDKKAEKLIDKLQEVETEPGGSKGNQWLPLQGNQIEDSGERLKYELEQSRFQLAEVRNQLHSLKRELSLYRRVVRQEVGEEYDLHELLNDKTWKGRSEEIERLKSEIANLESKAYSHKYLKNTIAIPQYNPHFPRIEELIPKRQVECLKLEVIKKKKKSEDKELSALMQEFGNLSLMYKASSNHNKILAQELRSLKEQLDHHEAKSKEDLELIKNLTAHQIQMKEMLDREAHLATLVNKNQDAAIDPRQEEELDATKYQTLWEVSEYQKQSLLEMAGRLTDRLEDVMSQAEEAEKHCLENQDRQKDLEEQVEAQKEAQKISAKSKKDKKSPKPQERTNLPVTAQLEAVREENEFLKTFLRKAIEMKEEDIKLYRVTMNSIRRQYLDALEKIRKPAEETDPPANT